MVLSEKGELSRRWCGERGRCCRETHRLSCVHHQVLGFASLYPPHAPRAAFEIESRMEVPERCRKQVVDEDRDRARHHTEDDQEPDHDANRGSRGGRPPARIECA